MFVTKHPNRYLLNLSHPEMAAMRRVIGAGMLVLSGEDRDGLWSHYTESERSLIGRWMRNDPLKLTGPRAITKRQRRKRQAVKEPLSPAA